MDGQPLNISGGTSLNSVTSLAPNTVPTNVSMATEVLSSNVAVVSGAQAVTDSTVSFELKLPKI